MSKYNSKKRFKEISNKSHYLRVDDSHPLELRIGLNDRGEKTIRFVGKFDRIKIKGTRTIEINYYGHLDNIVLSFSLIDSSYEDLFYLFCNDLIDASREMKQEQGHIFIVNRFDKWKNFGGSIKRFLSENEIKGLIGELLFMKDYMFIKYGVERSINSWSGAEKLIKDFSIDETWYEIKTSTRDKITISSIEQLDSDYEGKLAVYTFEKLSPEAINISLNPLVDEILELINNESMRSNFLIKLIDIGFYKEDYYNDFVYRIIDKKLYYVLDDFPRIKKDNLDEAISAVKYDIDLNSIDEFIGDENEI